MITPMESRDSLLHRWTMNQAQAAQDVEIQPAPILDAALLPRTVPWEDDLPHPPRNKFEREYQAFLKLRPGLLKTHRDKYVAIHEGAVVDSGDDNLELALRVYAKYGHVPIYIDQVTEQRRVERIPSMLRGRNSISS